MAGCPGKGLALVLCKSDTLLFMPMLTGMPSTRSSLGDYEGHESFPMTTSPWHCGVFEGWARWGLSYQNMVQRSFLVANIRNNIYAHTHIPQCTAK